jgi:hypothetical protein
VILNCAASASPLQTSLLSPFAGVVLTVMFCGFQLPVVVGLKATVTSTCSSGASDTGRVLEVACMVKGARPGDRIDCQAVAAGIADCELLRGRAERTTANKHVRECL